MFAREITFEHANITLKNFAGRPDDYNPKGGVREFAILLDPETAKEMAEAGWNVKVFKAKPGEEETPQAFIKVRVRFSNFPPKIVYMTSKKASVLTEKNVAILDDSEFENVDVTIRASFWEVGGKSGIKAYLKEMFVTIHENRLSEKYKDVMFDDEPKEDDV